MEVKGRNNSHDDDDDDDDDGNDYYYYHYCYYYYYHYCYYCYYHCYYYHYDGHDDDVNEINNHSNDGKNKKTSDDIVDNNTNYTIILNLIDLNYF